MPDSPTSRSSAPAKRPAVTPPRKSAVAAPQKGAVTAPRKGAVAAPRKGVGGPPLKSKAEKRAEAKAAKARALARRKRQQVLTVVGAAVVVLALIVGLIAWIGHSSSHPSAATASAAATTDPSASAADPTASASTAPFPPVPAGAYPALSKQPTVAKGTGTITKLTIKTLIQGTGAEVHTGETLNVNYVGATYADGKVFDSSWSRKQAFSFQVGAGNVIKGWDQGLIGVKVGSRVQLDIPAALAYGTNPTGGQPAGTLRFVVDVLSAA